ncbi:hypothetical protein ROE7235_02840 [Roseibaca ekhonensis]|jgi:hypothetical protein|uniref:Uncharacterized protein n=1 Tax=Roseinatronobacter ekhonensis TaxID=254356 RepID=A0A3B0MB44_9RHOB|nr:hypothetical protein ROE7235_02840 [Roseibaca ekhonensis]
MQSGYLVTATHVAFVRKAATAAFLFLGLAALSACGIRLPGNTDSPTELAEAVTEFRVVPTTRAFISVPSALLVMERDLGGAVEQRITLPNETSLAGENTIMLRAQQAGYARGTRFVLSEQLSQFGGAPSPFSGVAEGALTATSDTMGDITYTTISPGGDVVCVLAFRRTQTASRALPRGSRALDIMLRNCVSGSVQKALAPIGASAFGLGLPN